LATSQC